MKSKTNEENQTHQPETFLMIFDNVKRCKALDWEERVILSNHISYQRHGNEFYQTDTFQAKELGLSPAQISKYTARLKERGLIDTRMEYVPNPNGGRPIPKRYVKVIDMDKWIKGDKVPEVKNIVSPSKKRLMKKASESVEQRPESVVIKATTSLTANTSTPAKEIVVKTPVKTAKIKKDETLEEMLEQAESKALKPISQPSKIEKNGGAIVIDSVKDVDSSDKSGNILLRKINNGEQLELIKVEVKFDDGSLLPDEAVSLPNGKYFLNTLLSKFQERASTEQEV